jgi:hypothetical protein
MTSTQVRFIALLAVGGTAVLGSYVHGIATNPETRGLVWGDVPESLKPLYTVNMFLAAGGWFAFTSYLLFAVRPAEVRVGPFGYGLFVAAQAVALFASALWMPLTFQFLDAPSSGLWWLIRLDLLVVGIASLAILWGLWVIDPRYAPGWRRAALVGAVFFCLQTAVLDALVWPAFFPI